MKSFISCGCTLCELKSWPLEHWLNFDKMVEKIPITIAPRSLSYKWMGDLLGSLTKPRTVIERWLNWWQYWLKRDQRSSVEGLKPCPVGGATVLRFFISERNYKLLNIWVSFLGDIIENINNVLKFYFV